MWGFLFSIVLRQQNTLLGPAGITVAKQRLMTDIKDTGYQGCSVTQQWTPYNSRTVSDPQSRPS